MSHEVDPAPLRDHNRSLHWSSFRARNPAEAAQKRIFGPHQIRPRLAEPGAHKAHWEEGVAGGVIHLNPIDEEVVVVKAGDQWPRSPRPQFIGVLHQVVVGLVRAHLQLLYVERAKPERSRQVGRDVGILSGHHVG